MSTTTTVTRPTNIIYIKTSGFPISGVWWEANLACHISSCHHDHEIQTLSSVRYKLTLLQHVATVHNNPSVSIHADLSVSIMSRGTCS
jgi:hypothetical protein